MLHRRGLGKILLPGSSEDNHPKTASGKPSSSYLIASSTGVHRPPRIPETENSLTWKLYLNILHLGYTLYKDSPLNF